MNLYDVKKQELENLYNEFSEFNNYELNYENFNEFYRTGNRLGYEGEYFSRRGCLISRAMYSIKENNAVADDGLLKIIEAVCDEFTWALPAHISRDTKIPDKIIDLFSAETAQTLSEIAFYIELPEKLHERIHSLIFERVIEPYETGSFWWETCDMNWASVCGGCVGMTYLYEFPERFESVRERLINTMNCFLSGYGDDGACLEGLGYWGYGFGYFIYFAELLRRVRGIDLLSQDKVKKIAEFQHNMFLKNGVSVSFSDGFRNGSYNIGLTHFLKNEFGDEIKIPDENYRCDYDECYRWAGYLRSFIWLNPDFSSDVGNDLCEKYFCNAQWYINKKKNFSFAGKGGNNNEPHNHNDVGSFIIADGKNQLIADYGAGEYTADYFNDSCRYNYFCTSSMGHSLPIIDGNGQKPGKDFKAEVIKASDDEFVLDIAGAYDIEYLKKLRRSFKISDNEIILNDDFGFSCDKHEVTECLMSLAKPEIINRDIKIQNLIIKTDILPQIMKHTVKNHAGEEETVYSINYKLNADEFCCKFIFCEAL